MNLHTPSVSSISAKIAKLQKIRNILKKYQLRFVKKHKNCCIEGRDISTNILPNSKLKFYFVCNLNTASVRRFKELKKDNQAQKLYLETLQTPTNPTYENLIRFKDKLFQDLPFYENLLFNAETQTVRTIVYMDPDIVNTAVRKDFIFEEFIPLIERYEKQTGVNLRVSGMPYIRTLNAQNIVDEIGLFVLSATLLTALIFFLFFRSFRATFIALSVVLIGVMWALGTLGLFRYEITVLTALIPPLIIVIGVPNCIFLINKYQ